MLERASTCFETGGRQLLRAPRKCLATRRTLHSAFWHHGANELPLPPMWWATSTASNPPDPADTPEQPRTSHLSRSHDAPLLDFLYPEKTLALVHRWSALAVDAGDFRRNLVQAPGIRRYSTSQWIPDENVDTNKPLQKAEEDMERLLLQGTAEDALNRLLIAKSPGKENLAWLLFQSLPEPDRTKKVRRELWEYLADGDQARGATYITQLFDDTEPDERSASDYRMAITAYVTLKKIGPAILLHEEAASRIDTLDIGTDAIIKQTIEENQWDLTIRIFRTSYRQLVRLDPELASASTRQVVTSLSILWREVPQMSNLVEHYHSFFIHLRQYRSDLCSTEQQRKDMVLFTAGFLPAVMDHLIDDPEPDEDYIHDFFTNLFQDLKSLNIRARLLYEYSILKMLNTHRYRQYTHERKKIWLELYDRYRLTCKDTSPPSRRLISKLVIQHGEHESYEWVDNMIKDLRHYYPKQPFTPDTLSYVIQFYARLGLADKVHQYFEEFQTTFPHLLSLQHLSSLVYVYARRSDPREAVEQFKRINVEFDMEPDLVCWNNLLHAFCRADDLDGSLECFNNILDSGIKPDMWTFVPLLDLCANRGDIEAFETLFSKAKEMGIEVESDRRARSGYVQAFLNAGDAEGAEAIVKVMCRDWNTGTLSGDSLTHPWNILLFHYASQGHMDVTKRLYKQMKEQKIPVNTWTYAAIMRAMVETKQTNAAYKIARVTMRDQNMRMYAYHYAILITGFLRSGQYNVARRIMRRMDAIGVHQTESSRQATLLATGFLEMQKMKEERVRDPRARMIELEQKLREGIISDYGHEIAHNQPTYNKFLDAPELANVPAGYFGLVIMLYNARGAFEICKQLFEAATAKKAASENDHGVPISLLSSIMEVQFNAAEYDEVEKCWLLARRGAETLVKTFQEATEPESAVNPSSGVLTDPSVKARLQSVNISQKRRHILAKSARIYIRSLCAQHDRPDAMQQAQHTIYDLLTHGFILDSLTWNDYIQQLALRGRLLDAFTAFEMYLMPYFPGWEVIKDNFIRRYPIGHRWQAVRKPQMNSHTIMPRYKTIVVLAGALSQVYRDESNGLGYRPEMKAWMSDILKRVAPRTTQVIDAMPRTGDKLQAEYMYNF